MDLLYITEFQQISFTFSYYSKICLQTSIFFTKYSLYKSQTSSSSLSALLLGLISVLTHTDFAFVISLILVDFLLTHSGIKQGSAPLIHRMRQRLLHNVCYAHSLLCLPHFQLLGIKYFSSTWLLCDTFKLVSVCWTSSS